MSQALVYQSSREQLKKRLVVVLTTYMQEPYIRDSVTSLVNQSYCDFHIMLFDDASSDRTAEIAIDILRGQERVTWQAFVQRDNLGVARHHSFRAAQIRDLDCDYIAFCEGDDWWDIDRFQAQVSLMDQHDESVALTFSSIHIVQADGNLIGTQSLGEVSREISQREFLQLGPLNPNASTLYRFCALSRSPDCFDCIDYFRTVVCTAGGRKGLFTPGSLGFYRRGTGISAGESPWRRWLDLQHLDACNRFFLLYPSNSAAIFQRYLNCLRKVGVTPQQLGLVRQK